MPINPHLLPAPADADFEELDGIPGFELARQVSAVGGLELGGGHLRFTQDIELLDWTLRYDEVIFIAEGELELESEEGVVRAGPGETLVIGRGATVSYRGKAGTRGSFVLYPR